jgi:hypothetical protein
MNELIAGTDCNTAIDWTQGAHRRMACVCPDVARDRQEGLQGGQRITGLSANRVSEWRSLRDHDALGCLDRALAKASGAITLPVIFCGD